MPENRRQQHSWWKKRTKLEKILGFLFFFMVVIFLISHIFRKTTDSGDTCLTEQCIQTAAEVFSSIDETVDPCQNFYSFACGNYIKDVFVPTDRGSVSQLLTTQKMVLDQIHVLLEEESVNGEAKPFTQLKKFYRVCKNNSLIERHEVHIAKKLLKDLGGWPILDVSWSETEFDWIDTMAKLRANGLPTSSLIDIDVTTNFKNTFERVIKIGTPMFGLDVEFLIQGINNTIVRAYYDYMVDIAKIFGAKKFKARGELLAVINLEILLASYAVLDSGVKPEFLTVDEAEITYYKIRWLKLINTIMPPEVQVNSRETLLVESPKFLLDFEILMSRVPKRVQANYMMWRVVNAIIPFLNQRVKTRKLILNRAVYGILDLSPRWEECAVYSMTMLSLVTGASYVRQYYHEETTKHALDMVTYIKLQVKDMLHSADWLDYEIKRDALDKVNNILFHIGHPDELLDDNKIEEFYNKLEINETQFLSSSLSIAKFLRDFRLKRLREPVNKTDWRDHDISTMVNAYYSLHENSIVLPAAILQGVFFYKDRPKYMNFGAIGSIISHEITHAFDTMVSRYYKIGDQFNLWTKKNQDKFWNKTNCMIQQYNNFSLPEIEMNIDGEQTLGENIADNSGAKQAYLAYKNWQKNNPPEKKLPGLKYTQDQLYWLSAAQIWCSKQNRESLTRKVTNDVHSPHEIRVLGFLKNSEYFARDYNCPLGSEMNPKDKCSVW